MICAFTDHLLLLGNSETKSVVVSTVPVDAIDLMCPSVYPHMVALPTLPKTSKVTVTQDSDGYYRVRIPKAIGDAMGWSGQKVQVNIESGKKISLEETDD